MSTFTLFGREYEIQTLENTTEHDPSMYHQPELFDGDIWEGRRVGNFEIVLLEIIKQLEARITKLEDK